MHLGLTLHGHAVPTHSAWQERIRAERMRVQRDEAYAQRCAVQNSVHVACFTMASIGCDMYAYHQHGCTYLACKRRDDALAELATAFADMEAMQATLADSAVYVR